MNIKVKSVGNQTAIKFQFMHLVFSIWNNTPTSNKSTMILLLLIYLQLTLGELIPGNQVNFVSRGGYKYIGVPEVDKYYGRDLCITIF